MNYGVFCTLVGFYCGGFALAHRGYAWPLMWVGVSFSIVGLGYLCLGPKVFGKSASGRVHPAITVALLPYFVYVRTARACLRTLRSETAYNELLPGILFGRRVSAAELPDDTRTIFDLTGELSEPVEIRNHSGYHCRPLLDGSTCPPEQLAAIAQEIAHAERPIYIHCAEGHGRSGMVAAAVLLHLDIVETPEKAIKYVAEKRPKAQLHRAQRRTLQQLRSGNTNTKAETGHRPQK